MSERSLSFANNSLLKLNTFLFCILFLILALHGQLAGDDFFYLGLTKDLGAWKGMLFQYHDWSGRWSAHWIGCALLYWSPFFYFLPVFYLSTFSTIVFLCHRLLLQLKLTNSIQIWQSVMLSVLFTAGFFFTCFSIAETWFWYIIVITYLWSLIALVASLYLLCFRKMNKLNRTVIILCSMFIGGAAESISLFALFIYSTLFFIPLIRPQFELIKKEKRMMLGIALLVLLASSFIAYFAPGTAVRNSFMPEATILSRIWILFRTVIDVYVKLFVLKMPYLLLFSAPFLLMKSREKNISLKKIRNGSIVYIILSIASLAPTSLVMSETGPARSLVVFSILGFSFFIFILLELKKGVSISLQNKFALLIMMCSSIFLIQKIYTQYKVVNLFAEKYDMRIDHLQKLKAEGFTGVATLQPLPNSGLLYFDELSADTGFYNNTHLKSGLSLPFSVKLNTSKQTETTNNSGD